MVIFTSYYWYLQHGKIPAGYVPISISRTQPRGINLPSIPELMPSWAILDAYKHSARDAAAEAAYTQAYMAGIRQLDAGEIVARITAIAGGRPAVLMCYEGRDKFCHRHLAAEWLNENGYNVREL